MKQKNRSSYLSADDLPLQKKPISIWGYDKDEKFVCRLQINAAGVEVFGGAKGNTRICNLNWEGLVDKLKDDDQ